MPWWSTCGRGGRGNRGHDDEEHSQCSYCKRIAHTQDKCYSMHDFPNKTTNISKYKIVKRKS